MGLALTFVYFGVPTLLLFFATYLCIPLLHRLTGLLPVVCWYICGGTLVFLPIFIAAFYFYKRDGYPWQFKTLWIRFRLNNFSFKVFAISILSIVIISALTYLILEVGKRFFINYSPSPSFLTMKPIGPGEMWILLAWLPLFFFNILGEAFYWRGYIFPRQELAFGRYTWIWHGLFWLMFHLPFGINLLITLMPIIFITSYAVQKTKSTWTDIVIHAVINGTGFILVAFGVLGNNA
jgi:membrane protease YdiL (CAAX protease family)